MLLERITAGETLCQKTSRSSSFFYSSYSEKDSSYIKGLLEKGRNLGQDNLRRYSIFSVDHHREAFLEVNLAGDRLSCFLY